MTDPEFLPETDDRGIDGVAAGIVTDNEDPDQRGRVKLSFPWRDADDESYWARIATPMAGDDRGTYFLPEVGDEVLVAFEDGDIRHPYVLGALWNGQDAPPADNADGDNDVRVIRSRSGHEILLNDSDTEGRVEISTDAGHEILLDDSSGGERVAIEDSTGENVIELDSTSGTIDVESTATISLSAPMIELEGDGNVTVEAGGVLTLKGTMVKIN